MKEATLVENAEFHRLTHAIKTAASRRRLSSEELAALLIEAKEKRIWEVKYDSFKQYCEKEFQIGRQWAWELTTRQNPLLEIEAGQDVRSPYVETVENPANPHILAVGPEAKNEDKPRVVSAYSSDPAPSLLPPPANSKTGRARNPEKTKPAKAPVNAVVLDEEGLAIPPDLAVVWTVRDQIVKDLRQISVIKGAMERFQSDDKKPTGYEKINAQRVYENLLTAYEEIKLHMPHTSCPKCGAADGKCKTCKGTGWLCAAEWRSIPSEVKARHTKNKRNGK